MSKRHQHSHDGHSGHEHPPAITKRWKRAAVFGNFMLGCTELLTGNFRSLAVAADGIHNLGDSITYGIQSNDLLKTNISADKLKRRRKTAHWIIAVSSGAIGIKAGLDLASGIDKEANNFSLYAASASLAYNSALVLRLRSVVRQRHLELGPEIDCHREDDLTKHFLQLDIPSAALALGGVVAQKYGLANTEQLAAMASGALGVVAFRPTAGNLSHEH